MTRSERTFRMVCLLATVLPIAFLALLVGAVFVVALPRLDWSFLTGLPSRDPESAGILPGLVGTLYLMAITAVIALPVGIGTAIYLDELASRSEMSARFRRFAEVNLDNLAAVPSIIYGLLALEVFVRSLGMGASLLAGGLTMALLILPTVVISTRAALRAVPVELREAALALGSTRWQVVRGVVLPMALPGILTGSILSLSRAIGEAAPLVILGGLVYVDVLPGGLDSPFTVLPIQIFSWVHHLHSGFAVDAAAGVVVLLLTLLALNAAAIVLRNRLRVRL